MHMDELYLSVKLSARDERILINAAFPSSRKITRAAQLFGIYLDSLEEPKPREVSIQLFGTENMPAYQDVRKQLRKIITPIMIRQRSYKQGLASAESNDKLTYALIFIDKYPEIAEKHLADAEALALSNRHYDVLEKIYAAKLRFSTVLNLKPSIVYASWKYFDNLNSIKVTLDYAKSIIIGEVLNARISGSELNVEDAVNNTLHSSHHLLDSRPIPELHLIVVSTTRAIMMATKNFQQLLPYLFNRYDQLKKADAFTPADVLIEIKFIYYIAHAYYRNLDMKSARKWHSKMMEIIHALPAQGIYDLSSAIMLEAAIETFSGNLKAGISILSSALKNTTHLCIEDRANMCVNLAVKYVLKKDYQKALDVIMSVDLPVKEQDKKHGKEWRLKREMILLSIYYSLGDELKAQRCLDNLKKGYAEMLTQSQYVRASDFLDILGDVIKDGQILFSPEFQQRVREAKKGWEDTEDDLHAILFYTWLKSLMLGVDFYELLLERLQKPVRVVAKTKHAGLVNLASV